MAIPIKYTLRNFKKRKLTTIITLVGISLVVFVFAAVLMMAYGIQKTLVSTGSDDNVKILRKAANGEISSIIDGDGLSVIRSLNFIKKDADGSPIISGEPVVIINLEKFSGGLSNVTVRGVSQKFSLLRPQVKLVEGRMFNPSLRELIVGESISKEFKDAQVGSKVRFAGSSWTIVGKYSSGGSGFDSEMWGDAIQLLDAFNRSNVVSTVTLALESPARLEDFKRQFATDKRLQQYEVKTEKKFYEEQSELLATFIRILGIFITVIFSFGATIGAMITMYAAVANRTTEIGTMRALGFSRRSILTVFLTESIFIAILGGIIGLLLASLLSFYNVSTLNFGSFTELSFRFALSSDIIVTSLIFAAIMGILGGFLPSVRAARMNIVKALRAG